MDGIDANAKDVLQQTPLSCAATNGHEDVVRTLLASDKVNAAPLDAWKRTPVYWAERHGHKEVAELLRAATGGLSRMELS